MKEWVDMEGNLVFETGSKQISINIFKMRGLTGANIRSVFGRIKSLGGRLSDDGEAFKKENKKEGWICLNLDMIVNPKDKNSTVQRKIIDVLSHEARHITQPESKSGLLEFCRKLYIIFFLPLAIISALDVIALIVFWAKEFSAPIYVLLIFFPTFLIFIDIFYFLDPKERDARKFAKKAIKDKRWLEIVQVKEVKEK